MKKLITILGAVSLSASVGTQVVACTNKKANNFKIDQEQMSLFLTEVSKALYLNEKHRYDVNYTLEANVLTQNLDLQTYFAKNFNNSLFSQNFTSEGFINLAGKKPADKNLLLTLTNVAKQVLALDERKEKGPQLEALITSTLSILGLKLDAESLQTAKPILQAVGQNMTGISAALSLKNYVGQSWSAALNSAMIDLANGLNRFANINQTFDSKDLSATNFNAAMTAISQAIKILNADEKGLSLDQVINNLDSLGAFINLTKLALTYLNQFIVGATFGSDELTASEVIAQQNKIINISASVIDLRAIIVKLDVVLLGPAAETTGPAFIKNLLKVLFVNASQNYAQKTIETINIANLGASFAPITNLTYTQGDFGLPYLISAIINGSLSLDNNLITSLLGNLNLGNLFANMLAMMANNTPIMSASAGDSLKGILGMIMDSEAAHQIYQLLTNVDPLKLLWNQNLLEPILKMFTNISGDLSIQGILNTPLSALFGLDGLFGFDFITEGEDKAESISEIVKLVLKKLDTTGNCKFDLEKLAVITNGLGDLFKDLPDSVTAMVEKLDKTTIQTFFDMKKDLLGMVDLVEFIDQNVTKQQSELIAAVKSNFNSIKKVSATAESDFNYKFILSGKVIKITLIVEGEFVKIKQVSI